MTPGGNISFVAVGATTGGNIISVAFNATVGGNIIFVALIDTCFPVSISSAIYLLYFAWANKRFNSQGDSSVTTILFD